MSEGILPCPSCGGACSVPRVERHTHFRFHALCPRTACWYHGPERKTPAEAIAAHNTIAGAVARVAQLEARIVSEKTKVLILREALDRVHDAWRQGSSWLHDVQHPGWNPDAHVEVTLTVADLRAVVAAWASTRTTAPSEEAPDA